MQIARVVGTLVSTVKHPALAGKRLLVVQPCDPGGRPQGKAAMAVDTVDAGVGDWVLVLDEGASASGVLGNPRGPVRTLVVGVIDGVHLAEGSGGPGVAIGAGTRG